MNNIRSRNIEARFIRHGKYACEIVKWFPNEHYGHEDEYEEDSFGMYIKKGSSGILRVDKSCFVSPEHCYVICFITDGEKPGVVYVKDRYSELDLIDKEDFDYVKDKAMYRISQQETD